MKTYHSNQFVHYSNWCKVLVENHNVNRMLDLLKSYGYRAEVWQEGGFWSSIETDCGDDQIDFFKNQL